MGQTKLRQGQAELPTPESTHSYWHSDPSLELLGHRTTAKLPDQADVVVVGSGITGAFAAQELVQAGRNVLMLEAREACWGATGRNGGNCHPLIFMSKPHIAQFELDNYFFLRDLVAAHRIPCDWKSVGAVCALASDEAARDAKENVRLIRRNHPSLADKALYVESADELKRLRVPAARAAVVHPNAAKLWPYKLVAWVLEKLLRENSNNKKQPQQQQQQTGSGGIRFNLQTNTPVTHLQRFGASSWVLHTPRGQVLAKQVLLATNGYTSHLLPKMTGLISPVRGQIIAALPPAGSTPLVHTHIWASATSGADDYLIQRDNDGNNGGGGGGGGGIIILGGERTVPQSLTSRDDVVDEEVGRLLRGACHDTLELRPGGDEEEEEELRAEYEWTGIMGYSRDGHPWVGAVPEALDGGDGLFICAGFTGHGMPSTSRSGVAVARMMLGTGTGDVKLPPEFEVSEERAREAVKVALPQTWEEEIRMNMFWLQKE